MPYPRAPRLLQSLLVPFFSLLFILFILSFIHFTHLFIPHLIFYTGAYNKEKEDNKKENETAADGFDEFGEFDDSEDDDEDEEVPYDDEDDEGKLRGQRRETEVLGTLSVQTRKRVHGFLRVITRKPIHFSMGTTRFTHCA